MFKLVSVIMPCFNQGRFLGEAIESVLEQDYPHKELIVVNDGSVDNTADVALSYKDRIIYLVQENKGCWAARNAGLDRAKGDYIAFLDSDDVYLPGSLGYLTSHLEKHPDVGMVCGDLIFYTPDNNSMERGSKYGIVPRHSDDFRWDTVEFCAYPSTAMLRKTCFDTIGRFYTLWGKAGGEDWLLWVRLARFYKMVFLPEPIIVYRIHDSNVSHSRESHLVFHQIIKMLIDQPFFNGYPNHFRAKLLYSRLATACHERVVRDVVKYLAAALTTDPRQVGYGLYLVRRRVARLLVRLKRTFLE